MDHSRDPCPWVALNDFGGAFCMGVRMARFNPQAPANHFPHRLSVAQVILH